MGLNYRETNEQLKEAEKRFSQRLHETSYRPARYNCEHLVSFILTGIPGLHQILDAGRCKVLGIDIFDSLISNIRVNEMKTTGCCVADAIYAGCLTKSAVNR